MKYKVSVLDKSITLEGSDGNRYTIYIPDIQRILETTVDLLTTDEIVLTVEMKDGSGLAIPDGIGCSQFQLILDTLENYLPGFKASKVIRSANQNPFRLNDEVIWQRTPLD